MKKFLMATAIAVTIKGAFSASGCARGYRDGFLSQTTFPKIAACSLDDTSQLAGMSVNSDEVSNLVCAPGWHVCTGADINAAGDDINAFTAITKSNAQSFDGCYAYNAQNDCNGCQDTCIDNRDSDSSQLVSKEALYTPNYYNYQCHKADGTTCADISSYQAVVFRVKARNDAHIALSDVSGHNANKYEVVISGWSNTKSVIRYGNQYRNLVQKRTNGYLNQNEYREFWISWWDSGNKLRVGQGSIVGEQEFMNADLRDDKPINVIQFSTGWGSTGYWMVDKFEGCHTYLAGMGNDCIDTGSSNGCLASGRLGFNQSNQCTLSAQDLQNTKSGLLCCHNSYQVDCKPKFDLDVEEDEDEDSFANKMEELCPASSNTDSGSPDFTGDAELCGGQKVQRRYGATLRESLANGLFTSASPSDPCDAWCVGDITDSNRFFVWNTRGECWKSKKFGRGRSLCKQNSQEFTEYIQGQKDNICEDL